MKAVIMAGGEVMACAVPGAAQVGMLGDLPTFGAIWNGRILQDIRSKLNTSEEWPQCRTCSYREARVTSQQVLATNGERYDRDQRSSFTKKSVDFASPEPS